MDLFLLCIFRFPTSDFKFSTFCKNKNSFLGLSLRPFCFSFLFFRCYAGPLDLCLDTYPSPNPDLALLLQPIISPPSVPSIRSTPSFVSIHGSRRSPSCTSRARVVIHSLPQTSRSTRRFEHAGDRGPPFPLRHPFVQTAPCSASPNKLQFAPGAPEMACIALSTNALSLKG